MSKAITSYNIVHPQKKMVIVDGVETPVDDKQMVVATLCKRLNKTQHGEPQAFIAALMNIDGIDAFQLLGQYTVQIVIANTFDYDLVIEEIKAFLDNALSGIIIPLKPNAPKIST